MTDIPELDTGSTLRRLTREREALQRQRLVMREDLEAMVAASKDSNADDEHDPEGQTIAFERSQLTALSRQVERRLAEVDAALSRVFTHAYGRCEACGDLIAPARLEARPATRWCRRCAETRA